jgi:hypothetical protein
MPSRDKEKRKSRSSKVSKDDKLARLEKLEKLEKLRKLRKLEKLEKKSKRKSKGDDESGLRKEKRRSKKLKRRHSSDEEDAASGESSGGYDTEEELAEIRRKRKEARRRSADEIDDDDEPITRTSRKGGDVEAEAEDVGEPEDPEEVEGVEEHDGAEEPAGEVKAEAPEDKEEAEPAGVETDEPISKSDGKAVKAGDVLDAAGVEDKNSDGGRSGGDEGLVTNHSSAYATALEQFFKQLSSRMTRRIVFYFRRMYKQAQAGRSRKNREALKKKIVGIQSWNEAKVKTVAKQFVDNHRDIIRVFRFAYAANVLVMSVVIQRSHDSRDVEIDPPLFINFVHRCFIESARSIVDSVDILSDELSAKDYMKATKLLHGSVSDSIADTLRLMVPLHKITAITENDEEQYRDIENARGQEFDEEVDLKAGRRFEDEGDDDLEDLEDSEDSEDSGSKSGSESESDSGSESETESESESESESDSGSESETESESESGSDSGSESESEDELTRRPSRGRRGRREAADFM